MQLCLNEAEYAYYLIDKETAVVLEKTSWSEDGSIVFELPETAVLVKAYTRDEYGIRKSAMIGVWTPTENGVQYTAPDRLNYAHQLDEIYHMGDTAYRFAAGTDYALNYNINWYVYRNGSYFTNITTNNDNQISLELTEPGIYCISYYFRTANGEHEYWILPEIVI